MKTGFTSYPAYEAKAEELQEQIRQNAAGLLPGAEMMRSREDLQEAFPFALFEPAENKGLKRCHRVERNGL